MVRSLLNNKGHRGLHMTGGEGPWMDQPFVAPDVEPDSSTPLHENIHANQTRYERNKQHVEWDARMAKRHYLKQARTTFGDIDKRHNTSSDREANSYYGQQYRSAAEHKALLNEGWTGKKDAPYHAYLANTEPGPYMLPREPSILERLQDAIAKARE